MPLKPIADSLQALQKIMAQFGLDPKSKEAKTKLVKMPRWLKVHYRRMRKALRRKRRYERLKEKMQSKDK